MDLFYRDNDGEFKKLNELEDGIWRIETKEDMENVKFNKDLTLIRASDLPSATILSQFYVVRNKVHLSIFKFIDKILETDKKGITPRHAFSIVRLIEESLVSNRCPNCNKPLSEIFNAFVKSKFSNEFSIKCRKCSKKISVKATKLSSGHIDFEVTKKKNK